MNAAVVGTAGRVVLAAGAAVVLVLLCGCAGSTPAELVVGDLGTYPQVRSNPDQPLQVAGAHEPPAPGQGWTSFVSDWQVQGDPRTSYSVYVCLAGDAEPVVIDDVTPILEVGDGFAANGVVVRTSDEPLISAAGFPPAGGTSVPAAGAEYRRRCDDPSAAQQIILGLRATGPDGGGWLGVDVSYHEANGTQYLARVALAALMCGLQTTPCASAPPPTPS